jgi:hypothetical protein
MVIKGAVRNGKLVDVDFGWYVGRAGYQQTARGIEVAIFSGAEPKLSQPGTIDGQPFSIVKVATSQTVAGMTVLTVRPA